VESGGRGRTSLLQMLLKTYARLWEGSNAVIPSNNQWMWRGIGGSWASEDHEMQHFPMSYKFFLILTCLKFSLRGKILKKICSSLMNGWNSLFLLHLFWADKRKQTLSTRGNCLSYFLPLGFIWTQSVWIIVQHKVSHAGLSYSWRPRSPVEINSLIPSWFAS
jgi:hypothetical protein